jgi:peptidoglycan hydrolase CwlO-like protein
MNRLLTGFNFLGVAALGVLCFLQWGQISRLRAGAVVAARTIDDRDSALSKEKQAHARAEQDLADTRDRLAAAESAGDSARTRAATAEAKVAALSPQVDHLKSAVAERDKVLAEQQSLVRKIALERNGAITRCNGMVEKYNALVKQSTDADAGR